MSNEAQRVYWNEVAGPKWLKLGDTMDARFAEITACLFKTAAPCAGEQALDIGCGTGLTSLQLAQAVRPSGFAHGIDISAPLLEAAKQRAIHAENIAYFLADAQSYGFTQSRYDLLISRFGVMFLKTQ